MKKRTRGNPIPLIVEEHPEDYDGYPFITLIQYRNQHLLALVDNADNKYIRSFILDFCGPARVNEEHLIEVATQWWEKSRERYPISFEFSRLGMTGEVSGIYKAFSTEYVTRVIGPLPKFQMSEIHSVKRRKRKSVPAGVRIVERITHLKT